MKSAKSDEALKDIRKIVTGKGLAPKPGIIPEDQDDAEVLDLTQVVEEEEDFEDNISPSSKSFERARDSMEIINRKKKTASSNSISEVKAFVKKLKKTKELKQHIKADSHPPMPTTMEELVMALLKAPLKQWLDSNLERIVSNMVKEAVQKEISKIMEDEEEEN